MYGGFEYGGHALGTGTGWGVFGDANESLNQWRRTEYPDWFPKPSLSPAIMSGSSWIGEIYYDPVHWLQTFYPDSLLRKPALPIAIEAGSSWIGEIYYDPVHWLQTFYPDSLLRKPRLPDAIVSGSFWIGLVIPPVGGDIFTVIIMLNDAVPGAME